MTALSDSNMRNNEHGKQGKLEAKLGRISKVKAKVIPDVTQALGVVTLIPGEWPEQITGTPSKISGQKRLRNN